MWGKRIACTLYVLGFPVVLSLLVLDRRMAEDLYPRGDALEYAVTAASLSSGQGFTLRLGRHAYYPPKFPPGFPFLISLWYRVVGILPETAYWVSILSLGVASAAVFGIGRKVKDTLAGLAAVTLFAFSPLNLSLSGRVMSDGCSTALILTTFFFFLISADEPSRFRSLFYAALAGGALGWGIAVRPFNLLICPIVAAGWILSKKTSLQRRLSCPVVFFLSAGLTLVPCLMVNAENFGSLMGKGYALWSPEHCRNLASAYDPRNIWSSVDLQKWPDANGIRYTRLILGLNRQSEKNFFYGFPIWGLILYFFYRRIPWNRQRRLSLPPLVLVSVPTAVVWVVHYSLYFWQDPRFIHPVLPLASIWAGIGFSQLVGFNNRRADWIPFGVGVLFLIGACYPGAGEFYSTARKLHISPPPDGKTEIRYLRNLDSDLEKNAILISGCDCALVETVLVRGTDREHVPLDLFHAGSHLMGVYIHNIPVTPGCFRESGENPRPRPLFQPDDIGPTAYTRVLNECKKGRPVYLATWNLDRDDRSVERLKEDYSFEEGWEETGWVRLVPKESSD